MIREKKVVKAGKTESFFKLCFILLTGIIIWAKFYYISKDLPDRYSVIFLFLLLLVCFASFCYRNKMYDRISVRSFFWDKVSYNAMIFIIIAVSLITKLLAIVVFKIDSINNHPDINIYVTSANELGTTGFVQTNVSYLFDFSYLFWFSAFLSPVAAIFGVSQSAFSIYLSLVLTISSVLLFSAAAEQIGKNNAFLAVVVYNLLPGTFLLPQYVTHEISLIFFESIAIWLYFRCLPKCKEQSVRAIVFLLFSFNLLFATLVNTAGLIMCIAFGIIFFVKMLDNLKSSGNKNRGREIGLFAIQIVIVAVFLIGGRAVADKIQDSHSAGEKSNALNKIQWILYVGGSYEHGGLWNNEDQNEYNSYYYQGLTPEEIKTAHNNLVRTRYAELFGNPKNLLYLFKRKIDTMWGVYKYTIESTRSRITRANLRELYESQIYYIFIGIEYAVSLLAGVVCFAESIYRRHDKSDFCLFTELLLLGTTAMLLITECQSKYTTEIQPVFWLTCLALCTRRNTLKSVE